MLSFDDLVKRTGEPHSWREAMREVRAEYGRGARRHLANLFGVSPDTAGRWLAGKQAPGGKKGTRKGNETQRRIIESVDSRKAAARHMRTAQRLVVGDIFLQASSFSGNRNAGEYAVTPAIQARLNGVADALDRGDSAGAEKMFGDLVLDAYFNKGNVGGRHKQSSMGIGGYDDYADIIGD